MTATRPGGRTARTRAAVLDAVAHLLAHEGLAGIDLGAVAERAGVGRTTVYRRWGSVHALVADLVTDMVETSTPRARTGSIDTDLRANARLVRKTLADDRQGPLFAAVIAAAAGDAHVAELLRGFYDARIAEWSPCVVEAVERGELPEGTDPRTLVAAVSAPLYYAYLTRGERPSVAAADRAAGAACAAGRAGAYVV